MFKVSDYSVNYGENIVLKDINLAVTNHDIVAIIGPSGSGKTTLINGLIGLVQSNGQVQLDGKDFNLKDNVVSLVPQNYGLLPWKSVLENIVLANKIRYKGDLGKEKQSDIDYLINSLEIGSILNKFPGEISGGQAQRVALARAFSLKPDLLILDEAFSALDTVVKTKAQNIFIKQWQERPISTLLITHSLEEAILLSTKIFVLKDGTGYLKNNEMADIPSEKRKDSDMYYEYLSSLQQEVNQAWQN